MDKKMRTPLEVISGYGAPTHSPLAAITTLTDPDRPLTLRKNEYEEGIAEIIGADHPPVYFNDKMARLYFMYTVQETVRAFLGDSVPDMEDVWIHAQKRAEAFIQRNPWSIKDYYAEANNGEVKVDAVGAPKKKKGAKQEECHDLYLKLNDGKTTRVEIIQAFMDQVSMSKSGATTYFHNLKKEYGFSGPKPERKPRIKKPVDTSSEPTEKKVQKKRGPSKASIAREVYQEMKGQPKPDIIKEIVVRSGTTPAGANTYFCNCKKEFGA